MVEYVGLDVSKKETAICIKDASGAVLYRGKVATSPEAMFAVLRMHCACPERIVMETGTQSNWLARALCEKGLPAVVICAREAHALLKLQRNKTDASDAELLAEIARFDFVRRVVVKSESAQRKRMLVEARAHLLGQHLATRNMIRGLLRSLGICLAAGGSGFATRVAMAVAGDGELETMMAPLLGSLATQDREIGRLDHEVLHLAKADASVRLLMTVPGVGPVTALTYVATIDAIGRFQRSRSVGPYLGLTNKRYQSGEKDFSGRISREGDRLLRSLLFECANSLLYRVRKPHPLKDWARRLKRRSGHGKACVALARKLAVILHRMLVTGEAFRWPETERDAGRPAA